MLVRSCAFWNNFCIPEGDFLVFHRRISTQPGSYSTLSAQVLSEAIPRMPRRIKCILLTVLTSQIALFLIFYVLKDRADISIPWKFSRILTFGNEQKNSTHGISFLWDVIGWRDVSEDEFLNGRDKNGDIQETVELVSRNATHEPGVSVETTQRPRTSTEQTTLTPTTAIPENFKPFQQIDDKNIWMYSAYYDHVAAQQGTPRVRVFGIARSDLFQNLYCNFSTDNTSLHVTGGITGLPEHHGYKHHACYLLCNLPANVRPTHVSISSRPNSTSASRLEIIYPGNRSRNFTVCYAVLHSNYSSASQLIQSIEMSRILGAEHFMVYNYSISPAVDQILQRYQQDGSVTVLPWPVPTKELHYYGQMAALNDCNYRNRNISRFVVTVDTDEVIIPTNSLSWMEMIDSISPQERDVSGFMHPSVSSKKGLTVTGSFEFRSSFFTKNKEANWTAIPSQFAFSEVERNDTVKFNIFMLSQMWRSAKIFPAKDRTKYISRPQLAYVSGIHFVHSFVTKMRGVIVNPDLALVHHYRSWDFKDTVGDTSILRFKQQLYSRFLQQVQRFPSIFT